MWASSPKTDAGGVATSALKRLLARLKELRRRRGLTQEQFAALSGFSYKHYQAIEAGRKGDLRLLTLERLAAAHGIELYELFTPEPAKAAKQGKEP